ncbi:hypothetical protein V6Z12_D12G126900 [Gossypium hirsutum]
MVPEAPARPSAEVPIVAEAPARLRAYFADGARGSRTTKGLVCRLCPSLSHDQGPRLPMVPEVPAHPSTKGPMVAEAPARPRAYFADSAPGSRTTNVLHQGADGARGSRTTKGLGCRQCPRLLYIIASRCRWCPRLPLDQGPSLPIVSEVPDIPAPRGRWWPRLPHDQGPILPMVPEAPARPRA